MSRGALALVQSDGATVPNDFRPLVSALDRRDVDRVFANYWVAYRLEFESDEQILAMPSGQTAYTERSGHVVPVEQDFGRDPAQGRLVAGSARAAHVFLARGDALRTGRRVLVAAGYRPLAVPGFVLFLAPVK